MTKRLLSLRNVSTVIATGIMKNVTRTLALCFTLVLTYTELPAQLQLLKDIGREEQLSYNEYSSLTHGVGRMYYISNNELWKSNGTPESTLKLKSFVSLSNLTIVGTTLFFTADDGVSGVELWKTNGSPGNTVRVKDIMPGAASSSPANLADINGVLYFAAYQTATGVELWKSDGTDAGTTLVKDMANGKANGSPKNIVNVNGAAYFSATEGLNGFEIWRSDGTASTTLMLKDIYPGKLSGDPKCLTACNGKLYFSAYEPSTGTELWTTDGTKEGTMLLKDIRPGTPSSTPKNLIDIKGQLLFTANDGKYGDELWKTNGTAEGTVIVKDMNPGGVGSYSTTGPNAYFTNINGVLYFIASKGNQNYIYRSDGTAAGTVIVQQAFNVAGNPPQPEFTYMNGSVYYFNATDQYGEPALFRMPYKGTAPAIVVYLAYPEDGDLKKPYEMVHFYNNLYFFGRFSDRDKYEYYGGYKFIKSNGTAEGTVPVHDTFVPTLGSDPMEMITVNGIVYMRTYTYLSYTPGLFATNGTPEGTVRLAEDQYQYEWAAVGNQLYYVTENWDENKGYRWMLWRTSGTPATTFLVTEGEPDSEQEGMPMTLAGVGDLLYYSTSDGTLWRSNGTTEGTVALRSLNQVNSITSVDGSAYILSESAAGSLDLWRANGDDVYLVGNLGNGTSRMDYITSYDIYPTTAIGNVFYFVASTQANRYGVWRSDGTPSGTLPIVLPTNGDGTPIYALMELNNTLYFTAEYDDGTATLFYVNNNSEAVKVSDLPAAVVSYAVVNNKLIMFSNEKPGGGKRGIYASDGSEAGTVLLTTIDYFYWFDHAVSGKYVYFNTKFNERMWRTDGTACGTYQIDVGATEPFALEALGNNLVFGGTTLATGSEPHVYRNINAIPAPAPCDAAPAFAATNTSSRSTKSETPMSYPNPFNGNFTLHIKDNRNGTAEVAVFTSYGVPVENHSGIATNTNHSLGDEWPVGVYIVKVKMADKNMTYQVVKR